MFGQSIRYVFQRHILPFLISCVIAYTIYLVTGEAVYGAIVMAFALVGAIGGRLVGSSPLEAADEHSPSIAQRLLLHDRLLVRFAALFTLSTVLFVAAWSLGYYLLPGGVLRSAGAAPAEAVNQAAPTLFGELLSILTWNLTLPVVVIVLANLAMRVNGYPLGYLYPLFNSIMYGLTLGTNSFVFPMAERMAPSLAVLERAGPYEFAGYILITAATYSLARFEMPNFFRGTIRRVTPTPALRLTREQWLGMVLGVLIVALAGLREAMMIVAL